MAKKELDILVFAAHPDDAELSCGGSILKHVQLGKLIGIIDLTQGELGSRGSLEIRLSEAKQAAKLLGISLRENMAFPDGFFRNEQTHLLALIERIRRYKPAIVLANAISDRHPDHGRAATLVSEACFLAGLVKIRTYIGKQPQAPWRPRHVFHYIQERYIKPDFVVDITGFMEGKLKAIMAYRSQFYDPKSQEPATKISSAYYLEMIRARGSEMGNIMNVQYAEGFCTQRAPGLGNFFDVL